MVMKKAMFVMIPLAATMMFASCTKCKLCTRENSNEIRVCENDYNSQTEYGFAIDTYEALGYDCGESL